MLNQKTLNQITRGSMARGFGVYHKYCSSFLDSKMEIFQACQGRGKSFYAKGRMMKDYKKERGI